MGSPDEEAGQEQRVQRKRCAQGPRRLPRGAVDRKRCFLGLRGGALRRPPNRPQPLTVGRHRGRSLIRGSLLALLPVRGKQQHQQKRSRWNASGSIAIVRGGGRSRSYRSRCVCAEFPNATFKTRVFLCGTGFILPAGLQGLQSLTVKKCLKRSRMFHSYLEDNSGSLTTVCRFAGTMEGVFGPWDDSEETMVPEGP